MRLYEGQARATMGDIGKECGEADELARTRAKECDLVTIEASDENASWSSLDYWSCDQAAIVLKEERNVAPNA